MTECAQRPKRATFGLTHHISYKNITKNRERGQAYTRLTLISVHNLTRNTNETKEYEYRMHKVSLPVDYLSFLHIFSR